MKEWYYLRSINDKPVYIVRLTVGDGVRKTHIWDNGWKEEPKFLMMLNDATYDFDEISKDEAESLMKTL